MSAWQPIETISPFPFNKEKWFVSGPPYLLFDGAITIGQYGYNKRGKGRWQNHVRTINPTHWMPLPEPPQ